ncbi:hypothetical protein SPHINGO8BC_60102 [Sphingobacterium multivorum]|uniref:Uncharacterized protein n=1 Tax=Sphingobacterium multivorum TaxID=28454 RepID=A0A654DD30_SPHMU|nr:hypothetical protein SPHINGO8BC_60102 [Sphingobacterium multivorum]
MARIRINVIAKRLSKANAVGYNKIESGYVDFVFIPFYIRA